MVRGEAAELQRAVAAKMDQMLERASSQGLHDASRDAGAHDAEREAASAERKVRGEMEGGVWGVERQVHAWRVGGGRCGSCVWA